MIAWIDASVGAAGDMLLGALLDAGASADRLREGLAGLGLDGWTLHTEVVRRGPFRATRAIVTVDGRDPDGHHGHHGHPHRPYAEIRATIARAPLPDRVRDRALAVFERLATAEARLHGTTVDAVHLHEVGAVDALIDIVGVCLALEDLGVDRLVATDLPLGSGHVHGAHGRIPLPAPATLALCEGWPVGPAAGPGEWVTPTGAALVTTLATFGPMPQMVLGPVGHGAGRRNPDHVANVLRVALGTPRSGVCEPIDTLRCNLDDVLPEHLPGLVDGLLAAGAVDAWWTPIAMKKGRPGVTLAALVPPDRTDAVATWMLQNTPTLGVRLARGHREVLDRWHVRVETPWGPVRVKVAGRDGAAWHAKPEHDDVAAVAAAAGVGERAVFDAAMAAWHREAPPTAPARTGGRPPR